MVTLPHNYKALEGSHRPVQDHFRYIGRTNQHEKITTVVHLRRRPGHAPIPHFDEFIGCPARKRLPDEEFITKWGADEFDLSQIHQFCHQHGTRVTSNNHNASRQVFVEGTVAQFSRMFAVEFHDYEKEHIDLGRVRFRTCGQVHLPHYLHPAIINVSGLTNEPVMVAGVKNVPLPPGSELPPHTVTLTIDQIKAVYNVPTNSAAGQTIAIFSPSAAGLSRRSDLALACSNYGITVPKVTNVTIDGTVPGEGLGNSGSVGEVTLDIQMAAGFGGGADIAVYFTDISIAVAIARVVHPIPGDPICCTFSASFVYNNDSGFPATFISSFTSAMEDAALLGVTLFLPTGDWGSANNASYTSPGVPQIGLPCTNPWGTAIGGTILGSSSGDVSNSNYLEWVWNQATTTNPDKAGGTGGGISEIFPRPSYQDSGNIPTSIATGFAGRGVPDIAGNANGFPVFFNGVFVPTGGVSAATPMYAGIFTKITAALGSNVGFINPTLYHMKNGIYNASAINAVGQSFTDSDGNVWRLVNSASSGAQISINGNIEAGTSNVAYVIFYVPSHTYWQANTAGNWYTKTSASGSWVGPVPNPLPNLVCIRDIDGTTGGPQNNGGSAGTEGYPVGKGWDACSGWGVVNGVAFLDFVRVAGTDPPANEVFIQLQGVNATGAGPTSQAYGPFIADQAVVGSTSPEPVSASVTAVSNGVNQLTISWRAATFGSPLPITYDVYAAKTPSDALVKMTNTSALTATITFTASTLLPGSSVYVLVNSINKAGTGAVGSFFNGPFTVRTS